MDALVVAEIKVKPIKIVIFVFQDCIHKPRGRRLFLWDGTSTQTPTNAPQKEFPWPTRLFFKVSTFSFADLGFVMRCSLTVVVVGRMDAGVTIVSLAPFSMI